jgi:SAM-dependent methyltransferase
MPVLFPVGGVFSNALAFGARGWLSCAVMEHSIYEFPAIFRRVHKERPGDLDAEAWFLKKVWRRHYNRPVRRVLDIASGDSPHGQILARDGIETVGIDRSPTMIAAGRVEAHQLGKLRFYRRKIEKFTLPEPPFDAAIFMSETFPVMTTNAGILAHLESVGRLLKRGALYCIDIDRQDGIRAVRSRQMWRRRTLRAGGATVEVRAFNRPMPWYSGIHSIFELECKIRFPDREVATRDIVPIRYTLPCTLELAAKASRRFELVAAYADLSFVTPLEECDRQWLGVLRRV